MLHHSDGWDISAGSTGPKCGASPLGLSSACGEKRAATRSLISLLLGTTFLEFQFHFKFVPNYGLKNILTSIVFFFFFPP